MRRLILGFLLGFLVIVASPIPVLADPSDPGKEIFDKCMERFSASDIPGKKQDCICRCARDEMLAGTGGVEWAKRCGSRCGVETKPLDLDAARKEIRQGCLAKRGKNPVREWECFCGCVAEGVDPSLDMAGQTKLHERCSEKCRPK